MVKLYLIFIPLAATSSVPFGSQPNPNNAIRVQQTLTRTSRPTGMSVCDAFERLSSQCNRTLLNHDHLTPLNATHILRCSVQAGTGCHQIEKEIEYTMSRSTWWHCGGNLTHCLTHFDKDMSANLGSRDCSPLTCFNHTLPAHFPSLRNLAMKAIMYPLSAPTMGGDACQLKFSDEMELVINVLIQKARFCRFDIDLFANLIEMINQQRRQHLECLRAKRQRKVNGRKASAQPQLATPSQVQTTASPTSAQMMPTSSSSSSTRTVSIRAGTV